MKCLKLVRGIASFAVVDTSETRRDAARTRLPGSHSPLLTPFWTARQCDRVGFGMHSIMI